MVSDYGGSTVIVSFDDIELHMYLTNCIHKLCESIAKIICKLAFFEEIITGEWGSIRIFVVPSPPLIEVILYLKISF